MTITFKNGELKYCVNDIDLGVRINIDLSTKKSYLFVHVRNEHSKAEYLSNFSLNFYYSFFYFLIFFKWKMNLMMKEKKL